jgi:hypothetical protein
MLQFTKKSAVMLKELSQICQVWIKNNALCLSRHKNICRNSILKGVCKKVKKELSV